MHVKLLVEQPDFVQRGSPKRDGRTGGPEHVPCVVVLAAILFQREEDAATGERITEDVEVSPSRAGILESPTIAVLEQFGLDGCDFGIGFQHVDQR